MSSDTDDLAVAPEKAKKSRKQERYELVASLKDGERYQEKPAKCDGYLKKAPNQGHIWRRRYFRLENGLLRWSKSPNDMVKGKIHNQIDMGLAQLGIDRKSKKISIDSDMVRVRLWASDRKWLEEWFASLIKHRLFRQDELNYGGRVSVASTPPVPAAASSSASRPTGVSFASSGKVISWMFEKDQTSGINSDLTEIELTLRNLEVLMEHMEESIEPATTPVSTESSPIIHRRTKEILDPQSTISKRSSLSKMIPFRSRNRKLAESEKKARSSSSNQSLTKLDDSPVTDTSIEVSMHEFIASSRKVHAKMREVLLTMQTERDHVRRQSIKSRQPSNNDAYIIQLKQAFHDSEAQNAELRSRIAKIKQASSSNEFHPIKLPEIRAAEAIVTHNDVQRSASLRSDMSSNELVFHDAFDDFEIEAASDISEESSSVHSDRESEESEDDAASEDIIDEHIDSLLKSSGAVQRRTRLPQPQIKTRLNLMSMLTNKNNVGKDITRISMPVDICEPLGMLQLMCEELYYSDLIDTASQISDACERMAYVGAFAVSAYAGTCYRASTKPFTPLLGETYECIREDMGWNYVAEKVCHGPNIYASHAESASFTFQQTAEPKTHFWGFSANVEPHSVCRLTLKQRMEVYEWNKPTTHLKGIVKGTPRIEHSGDLIISCGEVKLKIRFVGSGYLSDDKHDVQGVISLKNEPKMYLHGKWSENIMVKTSEKSTNSRVIWRAGTLPADYDLYYGFTKFSIELNELLDHEEPYLPRTDSRFRPDMRAVENGDIASATEHKRRMEEAQRVRNRQGQPINPRWFKMNPADNFWEYTDTYWDSRREPGFDKLDLPNLF